MSVINDQERQFNEGSEVERGSSIELSANLDHDSVNLDHNGVNLDHNSANLDQYSVNLDRYVTSSEKLDRLLYPIELNETLTHEPPHPHDSSELKPLATRWYGPADPFYLTEEDARVLRMQRRLQNWRPAPSSHFARDLFDGRHPYQRCTDEPSEAEETVEPQTVQQERTVADSGSSPLSIAEPNNTPSGPPYQGDDSIAVIRQFYELPDSSAITAVPFDQPDSSETGSWWWWCC